MKYPICEKMGFLFEKRDGTVTLNENRFFNSLTYTDFRQYEDGSSYPKIILDEVEDYLANRVSYREEN